MYKYYLNDSKNHGFQCFHACCVPILICMKKIPSESYKFRLYLQCIILKIEVYV